MFVDDLKELIGNRVPNQQNTIYLGNGNIHMDTHEDNAAMAFSNTMETMGLEQHISGPTHKLEIHWT